MVHSGGKIADLVKKLNEKDDPQNYRQQTLEKNFKSALLEIKCQAIRYFRYSQILAIYEPMIYTAPCVMLLMRAASITMGKWERFGPWKSRLFWAL